MGDEDGIEERRHVGRATPVARQRCEAVGETGPAVNLDEQLGQVDLRQARFDQLAQPPLVDHVDGSRVNEEVAVGQLRLGGSVPLARE